MGAVREEDAHSRKIGTLHELVEVRRLLFRPATHDAFLSRAAAAAVEEVEVAGAGRRLSCWPPLLSTFTRVTTLTLRGHAMTALPHSVGDMTQLRVLAVTNGTLGSLPAELSLLSNLVDLDLHKNDLAMVPPALCALTGLTSLNLMGNRLAALPERFGDLTGLRKLGLKSNALTQLPPSFARLRGLVELFITDNRLETLPQGFGGLTSLVKLQASFNPWRALPPGLLSLPRLELFRLAAGGLPAWPGAGAGAPAAAGGGCHLPALAWCSLGDNPAAAPVPPTDGVRVVELSELEVDRVRPLGEGASGECFRAKLDGQDVALKLFLAEVSPDGKAQDEVAISCCLDHPNLTKVLALVYDKRDPWPSPAAAGGAAAAAAPAPAGPGAGRGAGGAAPHAGEAARGLVQQLVRGKPLAAKPTSEHLLRCKWPADAAFSLAAALAVCRGLAGALAYLHARRICHGDVYAHNVLYCPEQQSAVLCDFGASFCYREGEELWELMEVRAFGLLMSDVAERLDAAAAATPAAARLRALAARCAAVGPGRPRFAAVEAELLGMEPTHLLPATMRFAQRTAAVLLLALVAGAAVASANGGGPYKGGGKRSDKGGKKGGYGGGGGHYNPPSHSSSPKGGGVSIENSKIASDITLKQTSNIVNDNIRATASGGGNYGGNSASVSVNNEVDQKGEISVNVEGLGRRLLNTYGGGKGGYGGGKGGYGGGHKGGKGGYNPPSHPYPSKPSVSVKDSNILSNIQANQASVVAVKDIDVAAKGNKNYFGNNAIVELDTRPNMDQKIKLDTEFNGGRRLLNTYGGGHKGGKASVFVKDSNILSNLQANQASVVAVKDIDVTAKGDKNYFGNNAIVTLDTRPDMDQKIELDTEFN
ncbi:MAG: hypothetical protein J3K34DRAFT_517665 [Monoraphidium minutum]|nr:MAG: hypothetical protein J3K34DRAFT_517665 [Monoraphidium minutum]